ncbi:hypothetical protein Ahy_B02g060921 [Arachis hypogaea]|uniref:Glycoside hydrolase 35 catalytic domain-containing protein n=1 Tax=Arachis hypogaea TaxID=3818 RepID=A0A445AJP0_ARAHY|nr:hypothetical protein Ahy_B02g060921 [Arachis hypogaea]
MRRQPSQLSRRECSSNGIVEAVLAPTNARDMINEIENRSSHLLAYNFERRYDLVRFMKITHKTGLYAHLRIGPYVYVHVFKTIEEVFELYMEDLRAKQEEITKHDNDIKLIEDIIQTLGGKESISTSI